MSDKQSRTYSPSRMYALLMVLGLCATALLFRAGQLQFMETDFLQDQGEARHLRVDPIPTTRGIISDRNGEPLAVSTPVDSVWVNPEELLQAPHLIASLARILDADADDMERKLTQRAEREFVWLKRRVHPDVASQVRALEAPGVFLQKEYKRFYPAGAVTAHLLGFTNIDDVGQEGLELAYNDWLQGRPGAKRVIKDRLGRTVEEVELVREAQPGQELRLTIDKRLQYLAYRELLRTINEHGASSGSVVLLDVDSGEVLAMANYPSYNPNDLGGSNAHRRNRALTDLFEPGSVMKTFSITAALEYGVVQPGTQIDTNPGYMPLPGGFTIRDHHNYGVLDITGVITKSSNVAAAQIALDMNPEHLWNTYDRLGFGQATGTGFPGESAGRLRNHRRWSASEQATLSYGYGLSVTPLQLAQAFAAVGNGGRLVKPSLIHGATNPPVNIIDPAIAATVSAMLETVVGPEGTGKAARVEHYRVAGKTGTARKSSVGGYESRYVSSFAGYAPASNPRLVCIAVVDDPSNGVYYGGAVAGPLFSSVMAGSLRLLNIPPDDYESLLVQARPANPDRRKEGRQ